MSRVVVERKSERVIVYGRGIGTAQCQYNTHIITFQPTKVAVDTTDSLPELLLPLVVYYPRSLDRNWR